MAHHAAGLTLASHAVPCGGLMSLHGARCHGPVGRPSTPLPSRGHGTACMNARTCAALLGGSHGWRVAGVSSPRVHAGGASSALLGRVHQRRQLQQQRLSNMRYVHVEARSTWLGRALSVRLPSLHGGLRDAHVPTHQPDRQVVCFRRKGTRQGSRGSARRDRAQEPPEMPAQGFPYRGDPVPPEPRSLVLPLIGTAVVAATVLPSVITALFAAGAAMTFLPVLAFIGVAIAWTTFASMMLIVPLAMFLFPFLSLLFPAITFFIPAPGFSLGPLLDKVAALLALAHFCAAVFGSKSRLAVERDIDEDTMAEQILATPPLSSPAPEDRWAPLALLAWVPLVGPGAGWLLASARTPELSEERRDRYTKNALVYSIPPLLHLFNLAPGGGVSALGLSGLFTGTAWWVCLALGAIHLGLEAGQLRSAVQRVRREVVAEMVPVVGVGADASTQRQLDEFDARLGQVSTLDGERRGWW
eukprot:jgi/Mesvir1/3678/Mv14967-RA.1